MKPAFWHERWEEGDIGFHEGQPNEMLTGHFNTLALPEGGRVFVPLCGKTRDIHWLLEQGYRVAGVELSQLAVEQLFEELSMACDVEKCGALTCYRGEGIEIFSGDMFCLTSELLGTVDAIYDRAALVALPDEIRAMYRSHLLSISGNARQLLVTLEYEQDLLSGPPFSIGESEVRVYYGDVYEIVALDSQFSPDGLKGKYPVTERAWLLK